MSIYHLLYSNLIFFFNCVFFITNYKNSDVIFFLKMQIKKKFENKRKNTGHSCPSSPNVIIFSDTHDLVLY